MSTLLLVCGLLLLTGCSDQVTSSAGGCSITASITFDGRAYSAGGGAHRGAARMVRVGRLLGVGEAPTACFGGQGERIRVYKVVGEPVWKAVYAGPLFGFMQRTHDDGV